MIRDVDMHDAAAAVRKQDQDEQDPAGERRNGKEIHRRQTRHCPEVGFACPLGEARVQRRDRLGGVVHEYVLAA